MRDKEALRRPPGQRLFLSHGGSGDSDGHGGSGDSVDHGGSGDTGSHGGSASEPVPRHLRPESYYPPPQNKKIPWGKQGLYPAGM